MNRIAILIGFALLSLPSISAAEWYYMFDGPRKAVRVQFDESPPVQLQLAKIDLPVTALVLRPDTERADYFWLEIHLPKTEAIDSDGYLLVINGRSAGQILYRGHKWAIGFNSLEKARLCLRYLHKFHNINSKDVSDKTRA